MFNTGDDVIQVLQLQGSWFEMGQQYGTLTTKGMQQVWNTIIQPQIVVHGQNEGFHKTLLRLTKDYGGSTLAGCIKVTKGIVKWLRTDQEQLND